MAGEISKSFHFLQADNVMQVVVRKSGDVTEIWRRADADSKWNEGEVLPDSLSLSLHNSSPSPGTPPYRRP